MQASIEIKLNSNTKRIIATLIEGIEFYDQNYKKPNPSSSYWILSALINVSEDNIVNISCMAIGRSLHKGDATITIKYKKNNIIVEKTENVEEDTFSKRDGILLFKKEIQL